ncbi:hypothetical protein ACSSS7_007259 [Eimeria intestinalis]
MHQGEAPPGPSSPRGPLTGALLDLEAPMSATPLGAPSQGPPERAFLAAYFQKAENKAFAEAENGSLSKVAEMQIRTNLHQTLAAQLQQQVQLLQVRQADYRLQVKKKVLRQIKIVYPEAVDEEIEGMVDTGELTAATAIKMRTHQSLRNATADIQAKYRDIRRLEQSVTELHQMFVELSFLVEAQGEMVEHIQYTVSQAKEYTAKAEKELLQARRNQKSAKARTFWLTVILIIIATLVLVPIFVTVLK